ncbi:MAG: DUF116 domain-containing protein, partial [Anaerolineales bacterium]|nr:DUF116 domain-containing protein [Anaerolineales bacterium]
TLGVLWRVYISAACGLGALPRRALMDLARVRERNQRLKPMADALRGILASWFLSQHARTETDAPRSLETLDRLLGWLQATGNFNEEVKRLNNWRDFFAAQTPEQIADHLAAALAFADWFEARSADALGRYTRDVEEFLCATHPQYRGRADALFCGRQRVEYHLNMLGTEILNRALRASFLQARRKIVVVPPCMRAQSDAECQARATAFGAQCAACTPGCRIHQLTRLGEKYGFGVFILPDELKTFSGKTSGADDRVGIVGVSCVLTNAPGGWEMQTLGVPAQGLPLDYCGCRWHWHKDGIPTDINFQQALRVLGIHSQEYYTARTPELVSEFDQDAERWRPFIAIQLGDDLATLVLRQARVEFETLIPQIPYIGGEENHLTGSLVESAKCLALYEAMKQHGKSAADTGKILYDAILARVNEATIPLPVSQMLTDEELMARRKKRAEQSQERRYAGNYVYEFVLGDGVAFDYGYNFLECATQKFYHAQGADEFLPLFCFLDFPNSTKLGQGLSRTMTLGEGHTQCDHRFKKGRKTEPEWPPAFLKQKGAK